jgi:iron(III) transport system substrate-binding protein
MPRSIRLLAAAFAAVFTVSSHLAAAELPKATQAALAKGKFDALVLDGLDAELAVPKAWIDDAVKEKEVIILGTWENKEFSDMTAPFRERYPGINLRYSRGGTTQRTMQVLVALGEGRVTADVMTGFADATFQFKEMKALADLRELPGFKNLDGDVVANDGTWLAHKLSFRCMAYNTGLVKKEELPATWDDLVSAPRWRDGHLALTNNPDSWLLVLWTSKGEAWGADFTRKLFTDLKPQRRKEGLSAATGLTVVGESHASLPSPEWVVQKYVEKSAPVGYHCPAPVPVTVSQIAMLDKAPHRNAARLFINWMVSKEGQILQYVETFAVPVHKAMQTQSFLPFAETILKKPHVVRDDTMLSSDLNKKMNATWDGYWNAQGGAQKTPLP